MLALLVGADGVHLGEDDAPRRAPAASSARAPWLGAPPGASTSPLKAGRGRGLPWRQAVFATPTKPEGEVAGIALIWALAHEGLPVPWFAIGGVTLETAIAAPGYAVARAVLDAEDPEAARELRLLLK